MDNPEKPSPWKQIWKSRAPTKVACFTWMVFTEACLTHENLQKRGIVLTTKCFLCRRETDNTCHLLLQCQVTTQLGSSSWIWLVWSRSCQGQQVTSWSAGTERESGRESYYGGILYQRAYGGLFGVRETEDVLKTTLTPFKR